MDNGNGPGRTGVGRGRRRRPGTLGGRLAQPVWPAWFLSVLVLSSCRAAPIELLSVPSSGAAAPRRSAGPDAANRAALDRAFGRLPLTFEAAPGPAGVFLCRGAGYSLQVSAAESVLALHEAIPPQAPGPTPTSGPAAGPVAWRDRLRTGSAAPPSPTRTARLRLRLMGANVSAIAEGLEPSPTRVNYLVGNDPGRWRTGVPVFGRVRYRDVYPGVDLVYYGHQGQLEHDFVLAPGTRADQIRLEADGADEVALSPEGDLVLRTSAGTIRQCRPRVYQDLGDGRREIASRYVLAGEKGREIGFEIGEYDHDRPLVIDPVLVYSTFLGGNGPDKAWAVALDGNGGVYVAGETGSTNFPAGAGSSFGGGLSDVFVAKLGPEGTNLVYSTYLGGSDQDIAFALAVDGSGNVYLAGATASTNFPVTTNAFRNQLGGAPSFGYYNYDAFVAKLDPTGAGLLYSTYVGGSQADVANAIAVDGNGAIYLAGATASADFPTNAATTAPLQGGYDAFLVKLDTGAGTNAVYSKIFGGTGNDYIFGLGITGTGEAVVAGVTASLDFPVTNAMQTNFAGGQYDGFVARVSADGATTLVSTYFGGDGDDEFSRLVLDPAGNIYLTGLSSSTNLATANALYPTNAGFVDALVAKLDPAATQLLYATYLGGALNDEGWSIALDGDTNIYVIGRTVSTNFPVAHPYQSTAGGLSDVFVARLNASGTVLDYSTFLGGSYADEGYGIAVDAGGTAYISGTTASLEFPVSPSTNGLQTVFGGGDSDGFVARLFPWNAELGIAVTGQNDVTLTWPFGLPGYVLQSSGLSDGTNSTWAPVTNPPAVSGHDNVLTYSNTTDNRFFRLHRTQ